MNNLVKRVYKKSPFLDIQESHNTQRRAQTVRNVECIILEMKVGATSCREKKYKVLCDFRRTADLTC